MNTKQPMTVDPSDLTQGGFVQSTVTALIPTNNFSLH